MKTMKLGAIALLFMLGLGFVSAQSVAGSSKDVVEKSNTVVTEPVPNSSAMEEVQVPDRGIPLPESIEKLLTEEKANQAVAEFEKFKASSKRANPFHMLWAEMMFWSRVSQIDAINEARYMEKSNACMQQIIEKYPNESDTYLLLIKDDATPEQRLELATKAIEIDPDNINAYSVRAQALFQLGKTEEGCADLEKTPYGKYMPEYWNCKK